MTTTRRRFLAVPALAAAQAKTVEVAIRNQPAAAFEPAALKINSGDAVEWINSELITHTVTFDPAQAADASHAALPEGVKPFDSGDLEQDATFKHTFTVKGVYKYFCKHHEKMGMIGSVTVS